MYDPVHLCLQFGNTPLHTVCEKGNYEALKMYLKCVQVPDINAQNKVWTCHQLCGQCSILDTVVKHSYARSGSNHTSICCLKGGEGHDPPMYTGSPWEFPLGCY